MKNEMVLYLVFSVWFVIWQTALTGKTAMGENGINLSLGMIFEYSSCSY